MAEVLALPGAVQSTLGSRLKTLLRTTWALSKKLAKGNLFIFGILATWEAMPREVQEMILSEIEKALQKTYNSVDDLIDDMLINDDAAAVVADVVNRKTNNPRGIANVIPKAQRGLLPEKTLSVLEKRWNEKNATLDQKMSEPLRGDVTSLELAFEAMDHVTTVFNVRGPESIKQLQASLRVFLSLSEKDLNNVLAIWRR